MKRIIILLFISVSSCSPKLRSTINKKLPALSDTDLIVLLDIFDDQTITEDKIGDIKATDSGFSNNCSYYENIKSLKHLALI